MGNADSGNGVWDGACDETMPVIVLAKGPAESTTLNKMARPLGILQIRLSEGQTTSALPVFLAIARSIAEDARRGRLAPGTRLPGTRELAIALGVHRNTVIAAYRELAAEGFLRSERGRGTYIVSTLPEVRNRRWLSRRPTVPTMAPRPHFPFDASAYPPPFAPIPRGTLALFGGVPDTRLLPRAALARAYRRVLRDHPDLLDYGPAHGELRLRVALSEMLRGARRLPVSADDIVVTRGSQMALALLARALVRPGDVFAVEALGYQPAWNAFAQAGARLACVPVDGEGLVVDALGELCERAPVRAVYVTPHHQYPTTVTMSATRRMALLELARRKRFAIVEDDYDHEFHYDGRPVLPLASDDDVGVVLYVGTMSKVLAPGMRLGYLVAPAAVREAVVALRFALDRQGDRVGERAFAELMEEGELQRHFWRMRRVYQARRDRCVRELRHHLGRWLKFAVPPGGMALWARVDRKLPVAAWMDESARRGVLFQSGRQFTWGGRDTPHVRLGYAALTEDELSTAIGRLAEAACATIARET
jgi:GntR family transcriptional regulator/MocR family aminotransferase